MVPLAHNPFDTVTVTLTTATSNEGAKVGDVFAHLCTVTCWFSIPNICESTMRPLTFGCTFVRVAVPSPVGHFDSETGHKDQ
eukprot:428361-Amphidinium_carterae.2